MAANDVPCCEPMFWVYLVICTALVSFAGLMSGLTLGLMSLSLMDLEILAKAGQPQDRRNAEKILPIVKNQHLLLCTLLIGNSLAMEALPIFLDALLPAWGAILISVTLILAFGEIIPQAVCSRYGLSVGAKLSILVRLIVIALFPLAYPISKLLDWLLGKRHSALLRRAELKTLVDMHGNEAGKGGELTHEETTIITGALDMTQKTAKDAMTPISEIFSLDINSKLDGKTMAEIIRKGHSRVPICSESPTNIIGLILVKNLIQFRPEDETPIRDLTIRRIPRVHGNLPLYDMLNIFQKGHSHMAAVVDGENEENEINVKGIDHQSGENEQFNICLMNSCLCNSKIKSVERDLDKNLQAQVRFQEQQEQYIHDFSNEDVKSLPVLSEGVIGIITLEDVMEELIQTEILDETDEYVDVHNRIKVNMSSPSMRSPRAASASYLPCRTPIASPISPYRQSPLSSSNHTSILHSPVSPYTQSPFIRPVLSASPGKSTPHSPAIYSTTACHSPSSHRVSRKSYEKLRRPAGGF